MLKRKIEARLEAFAKSPSGRALLVDGARQVGKTYIVEECGKRLFDIVVKLDFVKSKQARAIFEGAEDEQDILTRLTAFTKERLIPGRTLFFFDEIQKCPEAVTFLKYLVQDGRFHFVLSGSLLGIELKNIRSVPVGFLDEAKMYPLDFEEFLWANGEQPELLEAAKKAWENRRPLAKFFHERLTRLFRLYLVTGGMPEAVQAYVNTRDIRKVIDVQRKILANYRRDISQYNEDEALRIRAVFDRIAPELSNRNKRFLSASVKPGGRFDRLEDAYLWLIESGVAIPSYCVGEPKVPLALSEKPRLFKLFMNDVGLLSATYMDGIQLKILNGETTMNFGAIFENVVAQELTAHGFRPNYYNSEKHGEVDFILENDGEVLPIEVKCGKHYERHHALSHLLNDTAAYGIKEAFVFDSDSFKAKDNVFYFPIYMTMFLAKNALPETMIYEV